MDPRGKSTRHGLPQTGMSHGRVPLAGSKHDLQACHTGVFLLSPSLVQFGKGHF
ncbi:hypothetical protein F383_38208 [Gossypium arboreum]|uniref:Uncharacterized protein n=1 Tax=Gossypium arboreum TaxID=29729 RepID=A0A0B0MJM3_GOSAR|nr:hypothetical protein F383_38208 [Gossypium arboreum]